MRLIGRLAPSFVRKHQDEEKEGGEREGKGGGKISRRQALLPLLGYRGCWPGPQVERNHESLPHSMEIHKGTTGPFVIPRVSTCPSRPWLANNVTLHGRRSRAKGGGKNQTRDKERDDG